MSSFFDIYPKDIGTFLTPTILPLEEVKKLRKQLPDNLIIRVFGLAGSGKGTLSHGLSVLLDIPCIDGGFILRAVTYIYNDLLLPFTKTNTDIVFSKMDIVIDENNQMQIFYKNKPLKEKDLKNSFVDTHVADYAKDPYIREKYYQKLGDFLADLNSPCVLDGRGAYPPYIKQAEENGGSILRILLHVDDHEAAKRYYQAEIEKKKKINPNYIESEEEKQAIHQEFNADILERNKKDLVISDQQNLGLITADTAVIDTTNLNVDQVIGTALKHIKDSL